MIESFLYLTWIGGQAVYWLFLRLQTETLGDQYWQALLLPLRESIGTASGRTQAAGVPT